MTTVRHLHLHSSLDFASFFSIQSRAEEKQFSTTFWQMQMEFDRPPPTFCQQIIIKDSRKMMKAGEKASWKKKNLSLMKMPIP